MLSLPYLIIKIQLLTNKPDSIPTKFMQVYSAVSVAGKTKARTFFLKNFIIY